VVWVWGGGGGDKAVMQVLSYCSKCKAVPVLNYTPHYLDDGR